MKRRDVSDPKVKEHLGRIVKTTGDGLLIEFASVIDAVRCAVEVQRMMAERNAIVPAEQRIEFRVGINLGDIIIEKGDISATGSMSRRALKLWPRPAASASAGWCAIVCATGLIALSKTRASSRSRTYPASAGVCAKPGSSRRSAGTERSTRHATVAVPQRGPAVDRGAAHQISVTTGVSNILSWGCAMCRRERPADGEPRPRQCSANLY